MASNTSSFSDEQLWRDCSVYSARIRKSAQALARIAAELRSESPLGGEEAEFLSLFDRVAAASAEDFTELWGEPFAYYWARTASDLLDALREDNTSDPFVERYLDSTGALTVREAFARHLELFKLFAIGLSARNGEIWHFEKPLVLDLPFALVGTSISFSGKGEVALLGAGSGCVNIQYEGESLEVPLEAEKSWRHSALTRHICPEIDLGSGNVKMRMQPHAMKLPDLVSMRQDPLPKMPLQKELRDCLADAVAAIGRYLPEASEQLRYGGRIAVVKQRTETGPTNASFSRLPGAVLFSARRNPLVLADDLIHEVHHNRLYALEEGQSFFDNRRVHATQDARFYSPWRADPRPLYGIFHAVYVFTRVMRFWLEAFRSGELKGDDRAYALERLVRFREQLSTGLAVLDQQADFTEHGQGLFDELREEIIAIIREATVVGVPHDTAAMTAIEDGSFEFELGLDTDEPITVLEAIEEHCRHNDPESQAVAARSAVAALSV